MAQRSKDLLQLEHNNTSISSLESAVLVCKKDSTSEKKRPPNGLPLTNPVPRSQLLGKVQDFLGVMSEANKRLEFDAKENPQNYDIEELTGNESEVIEMDLMLGVADLHTPEAVAAAESAISNRQPVIPLVADSSETDSHESSSEESSGDNKGSSDDNEDDSDSECKKSSSQSISRKDNTLCKHKGNHRLKKRPKIVELS